MRKIVTAAVAALFGAALAAPVAAYATTPPPRHEVPCDMPAGWYVNPDEQDRLPQPIGSGVQFLGNDLMHHATSLDVADLTPGTFVANSVPDQPSFFSVEVMGADGKYGTLRWNTTTSKWNVVTQGGFYENASPAALVDMPPIHLSHHVVSFGVGFTANPPSAGGTLVTSVTFRDVTYSLLCGGGTSSPSASASASTSTSASASVSTSASASASTSASTSASVSASASSRSPGGTSPSASASPSISAAGVVTTTSPVSSSGALPTTGPAGWAFAVAAGALLAGGALVFVLARRRRTRFTA
ncbi:LPXTG cell wall anchor domain-containing protein [Paractinoplanes toevensis]|uniref:LPXTG cell wall anchor domain-containing protein n=1 Tax=Paractinoplanes toevensis TaxID=571911 RepID=UPI001BB41D7A|nr:LPXTG cell wall anchor domain-containing protein [Actinoplanes toevensis]